MRARSVACAQKQKRLRRRVSTPCVLLFLACFGTVSPLECPRRCVCSGTRVECTNQNLTSIPQPLPVNTTTLFLTGNNISNLTEEAFPVVLDQLSELYLAGNRIEQVGPGAFHNLPSLHLLNMSNNRLLNFSPDAFPEDNSLQVLDMTRSLYNFFHVNVVSNLLQRSVKLSNLSLASNGLMILPEASFAALPELTTLDLRNNSIISIKNVTFRNPELNSLDLRDNSLKELPNGTLFDFSQIPGLQLFLAGNPWRCDCNIMDMVMWLQHTDFVVDKLNLTCAWPMALQNTRVLEHTKLTCNPNGDGVLETSYVFLGMVLALIGVIFLLVLYLNRKGIKRWIYNIRDACRDHMEGYHYRYEINSDPRLANLSLNSDV